MEKYKNQGGGSGVEAYEYGNDFILVKFTTGKRKEYKYTNKSAGAENVEKMIALAKQGSGLNAFINTEVKFLYEK